MCSVTTAKPLDAAMAKEVQAALNGFLKQGEKAEIEYKVRSTFRARIWKDLSEGVELF